MKILPTATFSAVKSVKSDSNSCSYRDPSLHYRIEQLSAHLNSAIFICFEVAKCKPKDLCRIYLFVLISRKTCIYFSHIPTLHIVYNI